MFEASKQGRKCSAPSSACLAMLRASLGAEQQAALAAVPIRHSRSACAGRSLGLTGKNTPISFTQKFLLCRRSLQCPCHPGSPSWRTSTPRIPLPPWGCRHGSAPTAMGRTPTFPCPALGIAPVPPLPDLGRGTSGPAICVPNW